MNIWQSWSAAWKQRRDRLLSNPAFQRWSLRLPLTSWIARRRMRALFDLCSGFVYSQVLLACVRLNLFKRLAESPRSAVELAHDLDIPEASVLRLLESAESLRLVEQRGNKRADQAFGLGPLGAALLGNPAVGHMIEHHSALYSDLSDPVALLRGQPQSNDLARFWGYSNNANPTALKSEDTTAYSELMAASQAMIADQVLSAYPMRRHQHLLDVGGGAGAFASAALEHHAQLKARVFDLPSVAEQALQRFTQLGLEQRASICAGDFLNDALPTEHDLISLVRILHDHNDDAVMRLLQAVRQAIAPDGVLLIAEPMLGTRAAESVGAYFAFYLMAMGQGRPRSAETLTAMLHRAGFAEVRAHRTSAPLLVRVLTARPDQSQGR